MGFGYQMQTFSLILRLKLGAAAKKRKETTKDTVHTEFLSPSLMVIKLRRAFLRQPADSLLPDSYVVQRILKSPRSLQYPPVIRGIGPVNH